MTATSAKFPGTVTGGLIGQSGRQAWTSVTNVTASDNVYATATLATLNKLTAVIRATNFGFTSTDIPSGATINGILVEIEAKTSGNTVTFSNALLTLNVSGDATDEIGTNQATGNVPTVEAFTSFGGSTNLWGSTTATITQSLVTNLNFGVDFDFKQTVNTGNTVSVDSVRMTVYYTAVTGYTMTASPGGYNYVGTLVRLGAGRVVAAAVGSYATTGTAALLKAQRYIAAGTRAFTYTGTTTLLKAGRYVAPAVGSFTISGVTTRLLAGRRIPIAVGSYAITGQAALLSRTKKVLANVGSYATSGVTTLLKAGRRLPAAIGSYSATGTSALLLAGRSLPAAPGSYSTAGVTATLTQTALLPAAPGAYLITGNVVAVTRGARVVATPGSYAATGTPITFALTRRISAVAGSYTYAGTTVTMRRNVIMPAAPGSYGFSGTSSGLFAGRRTRPTPGSYAISGVVPIFRPGKAFYPSVGSYTLNGTAVTGKHTYRLAAVPGVIQLFGSPALLIHNAYILASQRRDLIVFRMNEIENIRLQKLNALSEMVLVGAVDVLSVAELQAISPDRGLNAHCWDEAGGYVAVFADGIHWRRCTDRAVIS